MAKISDKRLSALRNEIVMSEKFIHEEVRPVIEEAVSRYIGYFIPLIGQDWDILLNEVYPIVQNNLPSIFFRNPRAFLKPRNKTYIAKRRDPISGNKVDVQLDSQKSATTQEHILNYILTQIGYKKEVRKVLLDSLLFPFGILWHGYKGDFGMTEENSIFIKNDQVFVKRIPPQRFIKDPAVSYSNLEEARWVGRTMDMRLEDVVEDENLDVDKKQIRGFHGFGEVVGGGFPAVDKNGRPLGKNATDKTPIPHMGQTLLSFTEEQFRQSSSSRFVRVSEIFLRPNKKEKRDGSKGWILLLTEEQDKPLRVNEWKIKAEGFPAHLLEFNPVNDRMFGIPDIDTYKQIADQKNIITNLQIRNAQENTKVWVGINKAQGDEEDIQKVQEGENTVILFEGDTPASQRMFVASPGGQASSELYLIDQRIQRNLEDKSGVTDLKRGFLQSGEESATSVKIRSAGGGARPAYRQDIMSDFLKDSMLYINQINKQFMTVKDAVRVIGSLDLEWSDEPSKEELQADVDVEIDAISMLPENPEKELREFQTALALSVDAVRDPALAGKIAREGKTIQLSPLIEQILMRLKLRDPDIFRNIRPEESQGFVSVAEVRAAKANVEAALSGNPNLPSPPDREQDHVARIEVYSTVLNLIQGIGDNIASQLLGQLIQIHNAFLQEIEAKQPRAGQVTELRTPKIRPVASV